MERFLCLNFFTVFNVFRNQFSNVEPCWVKTILVGSNNEHLKDKWAECFRKRALTKIWKRFLGSIFLQFSMFLGISSLMSSPLQLKPFWWDKLMNKQNINRKCMVVNMHCRKYGNVSLFELFYIFQRFYISVQKCRAMLS